MCGGPALLDGSTRITVERCADPPMVDLDIIGVLAAANATFLYLTETFRESGSVSEGEVNITVNVWRNWTALVFSVSFPLVDTPFHEHLHEQLVIRLTRFTAFPLVLYMSTYKYCC